jgi:hypothetical protein
VSPPGDGPPQEQITLAVPHTSASVLYLEPILDPEALPKRCLAGATAALPAKHKRTKKVAPAASLLGSLPGTDPVVPREVCQALHSPINVCSLDSQQSIELEPEETNYSSSPCWEHVYALKSNVMPVVRPIINGLPL